MTPGCLPTGARSCARCHHGHKAGFRGRPDLGAAKKTNTDVFGWDLEGEDRPLPHPACALPEERGRRKPARLPGSAGRSGADSPGPPPAPPPSAGCARAQPPLLSGVSPGALLAFSLSLLFFLGLSGSHPRALSLSRPRPVPFNFLLSRDENFAPERAAARRRYWPAPRPAAPPPAPALPSAPHSGREWRPLRSPRRRACVCVSRRQPA